MCRLIVIICKNISGNICGAENITTHILLQCQSTTDGKGCYRYDHDKAIVCRKYFIMEISSGMRVIQCDSMDINFTFICRLNDE